MVLTRLQITTDRVTTVFRKGSSRSPRTFTSRDGSDLLPLRLPWHCSWVKRFCRPPQSGGFANFATFAHSPNSPAVFALRLCSRSLVAGWSRPACAPVLARSSNLDPSGPLRQSAGSKLPDGSDSAWRGFFRCTPRRAVPYSQFLTGATPSRGTGESCLSHLAMGRGATDQLRRPFPGCPGVSHGGIHSFFHYCGHCRAPDGCWHACNDAFRTSTLPGGRPRLLAGRWPLGTGLTSYLSGCFRFAVG
jgi:hypothetical protein